MADTTNPDGKDFSKVPMVWKPDGKSGRQIRKLMKNIEEKYQIKFDGYWDFHQWSVENLAEFWEEMWDFTGIIYSQRFHKVIDVDAPLSKCPEWFEGGKLNYAENILKYRDDKIALILPGEDVATTKMTYRELYKEAELYAAAFRKFGIEKGDVVMCFMSNRKEAVLGMLAAVSIGALWTGALPQMGPEAVLNRVSQVNPKLLLTVDRFSFNREETDMLPKLEKIAISLPSLKKVIIVPSKEESKKKNISKIKNSCFLDEFLSLGRDADGSVPPMKFEQVSMSYPVFINFTSGTTGLPKAVIHGSGVLLTIARDYGIHMDTSRDGVFLSVSPVGWASWCIFNTILFCGNTVVNYDGSAFFLHPTSIWDLVDEHRITHLFITASALDEIEKQGFLPNSSHSLKSLRVVNAAASVVKPKSYDFIYDKLKLDVLFASPYGATEIMGCCCMLDFTIPVHKGEAQAPVLGTRVECIDELTGWHVEGEVSDLVVSTPSPGLLLGLLGDKDGSKLREKYFIYPDKFYLGDNGIVNPITKGLVILGRSDDTLKQRGCRFGSSEIYNVVEQFPEVHDSLCVSQYNKDRDERAVLFLKMMEGHTFSEVLVNRIRQRIALDLTPRHVPDVILETKGIPVNTNGKKMEITVKKIINSLPCNNDAIANPDCIQFYRNRPELQGDF